MAETNLPKVGQTFAIWLWVVFFVLLLGGIIGLLVSQHRHPPSDKRNNTGLVDPAAPTNAQAAGIPSRTLATI
jgi:hypothetical protein